MNNRLQKSHVKEPPPESGIKDEGIAPPSTSCVWGTAALTISASIPVIIGMVRIYNAWEYNASLPPDLPRCGANALLTFVIIFVGTPLCGILGALIGWIASKIVR